jgi:hypothetical protein
VASSAQLLALHGVRIKGMADAAAVARRFGLDPGDVEELLLDDEASGFVRRAGFADVRGWSLTDAGRDEDQRRLAAELDAAGARDVVAAAHAAFVGLNGRFLDAITRWQIRPTSWDPMMRNDHRDWRWDDRVLRDLAGLARRVRPVEEQLCAALPRFSGYADRLVAALGRVDEGQHRWVDEPGLDSCHLVWFELHEDLLATLGLERGPGA